MKQRSVGAGTLPGDVSCPDTHRWLAFLDSLRFIAAASVVVQHAFDRSHGLAKLWLNLWSPGVFGVVVFFIINGFVIPLTAETNFVLRKFVIRRLFRIYPLVLFALVLAAVAGHLGDRPDFDIAVTI